MSNYFLEILNRHKTIALDMDGTMVGGPHSKFLVQYVNSNPQNVYHIITFRDKIWAKQSWGELTKSGLNTKLIRSVQSCPEGIHDTHMMLKRHPEACAIYKEQNNLTDNEFYSLADQFVFWKGERASILGCTILLDDLKEAVLPGCKMHGIEFLHII